MRLIKLRQNVILGLCLGTVLLMIFVFGVAASAKSVSSHERSIDATEVQVSTSSSGRSSGRSFFQRLIPLVGASYSSLYSERNLSRVDNQTFTAGVAFTGGVLMDLGRANWVAETGLLYRRTDVTERGSNVHDNPSIPRTNFQDSLTLDYVVLPLSLKYYFGQITRTSFFLKLGTSVSYLVSAHYLSTIQYQDSSSDVTGNMARTEIGLQAGLGVSTPMSKNVFFVADLSGYRAITPIVDRQDIYNNGISGLVGVSYMF